MGLSGWSTEGAAEGKVEDRAYIGGAVTQEYRDRYAVTGKKGREKGGEVFAGSAKGSTCAKRAQKGLASGVMHVRKEGEVVL